MNHETRQMGENRGSMEEALAQVQTLSAPRGASHIAHEVTHTAVTKGFWLDALAEELLLTVPSHRRRNIKEDDLRSYIFWCMEMRVLQVNRELDRFQEDEVRVLSILHPLLCGVGEYQSPAERLWIMPTIERTLEEVVSDFPKMNAVAAELNALGFETSMGLPVDREIDKPDAYMVEQTETALNMPFKAEFNPQIIVLRLLYRIEFNQVLFGRAGKEYVVLKECRAVPMKLAIGANRNVKR